MIFRLTIDNDEVMSAIHNGGCTNMAEIMQKHAQKWRGATYHEATFDLPEAQEIVRTCLSAGVGVYIKRVYMHSSPVKLEMVPLNEEEKRLLTPEAVAKIEKLYESFDGDYPTSPSDLEDTD
jgi:hypothetical protein